MILEKIEEAIEILMKINCYFYCINCYKWIKDDGSGKHKVCLGSH